VLSVDNGSHHGYNDHTQTGEMTEITLEDLEENFEQVIERVEDGEHFLIRTTDNKDCVLMPYDDYSDYYDGYFEHDEAC
jgi:prevent-host-death family protein